VPKEIRKLIRQLSRENHFQTENRAIEEQSDEVILVIFRRGL
jgi:hypothetical protein